MVKRNKYWPENVLNNCAQYTYVFTKVLEREKCGQNEQQDKKVFGNGYGKQFV